MKLMTMWMIITLLGLAVAGAWTSVPILKTTVHAGLDPTFGALMNWNLNLGFIVIVSLFTLITVILQKYMVDQNALKTIKDEQKIVNQEMKMLKDNPTKQMELSKKSMELQMKAMPLTMRPIIYTTIPFILTFRWFSDYFLIHPEKLLGFFNPNNISLFPQWVWAYMIVSIVASMVLRKVLKVQ